MAREFMKDADVESAIKTVLATVAMDPRIAGAVLEKLWGSIANSWEDTPQGSRRMCVQHTDWVLVDIQHENGSFVGYMLLGPPAGHTFTSLEDAKRGMDSLLVREGWVLIP